MKYVLTSACVPHIHSQVPEGGVLLSVSTWRDAVSDLVEL